MEVNVRLREKGSADRRLEGAEELGPKMMEDNAVMALAPLPPKGTAR